MFGFTLVLGLAAYARAQSNPENELVDGKRVWITYPGKGWLVPAGQIVGKNADGSYKVAIYEYDLDDKTRSPARVQDIQFRGLPIRTVDVPAAELTRWNTTKFDAWVERNGQPWPKAKIMEDVGDKVVVAVYDTKGEKVESTLTITDKKELKKFRDLNKLTAPDDKLKSEIGPKTEELIDATNRELRKADFKLSNGEPYPKIHSLPEIVSELKGVAERWKPLLEREINVHKVASLQEEMLRELYVKFEELAQIKHSGRDTTSSEWKKMGGDLASKARATGDPRTQGQSLQETLLGRAISCFEKSQVAWQLMNLADVPALTGVGFRLLSWGFHGTLAARLSNGSWREWETTEGFEPPLTRAFKPFSVEFDGPGDNGNGLNHATSGISPMSASGEIEAPVGKKLDRSKAKVWLDLSWKALSDLEKRTVEVNVATGEVNVSAQVKDDKGNVAWKTFKGQATPEELARLQRDMNATDFARLGDKVTPDGRGPHFVFTGPSFSKHEGQSQSFAEDSPLRDFVFLSQVIGRRISFANDLTWGHHVKTDVVDPATDPDALVDPATGASGSGSYRRGADLARLRGSMRAPSDTRGVSGLLDDRIRQDGKATVDAIDGGR